MPGRVPALEIMINSMAIKECIIDPEKTVEIPEYLEQGEVQYGMQTFDQAIMKLYKRGMISFEEAMAQASNPDDFDLRLRGITGSSDRWDEEGSSSDDGLQHNHNPDQLDANSDFTKY